MRGIQLAAMSDRYICITDADSIAHKSYSIFIVIEVPVSLVLFLNCVIRLAEHIKTIKIVIWTRKTYIEKQKAKFEVNAVAFQEI